MRQGQGWDAEVRSSALWGKGGRGERRSSALWGKGGRGLATATVAAVTLILPLAAGANGNAARAEKAPTYVAPGVYQAAEKDPKGSVALIIQSASGTQAAKQVFKLIEQEARAQANAARQEADSARRAANAAEIEAKQAEAAAQDAEKAALAATEAAQKAREEADEALASSPNKAKKKLDAAAKAERLALEAEAAAKAAAEKAQAARSAATEAAARAAQAEAAAAEAELEAVSPSRNERDLAIIGAVAAEVRSNAVKKLAKLPGLTVTLDAEVKKADYTSSQLWVHQNGASKLWPSALRTGPKGATIAVIDSGIDKGLPSFGTGSRVIDRQVFTTLPQGSGPDGRGHGSFVAGIAAGEAAGYAGVSPDSDLVDLDVMDDSGRARTSDVIAACEWVLANKDSRGIRVVNMSLHSSAVLSIKHHPLNRAVEKLWFSGVVVVAAAGNYGIATGPSGVKHAPGNDPFVITVGAVDLAGSSRPYKHDVPYWSAYGYTNEGFAKPDLVAAGRYLVGPVPPGATLRIDKAASIVDAGYMRLSGTSFATPVVAGMVAQILARHPEYTPDRVKGVLMATSRRIPEASRLEQGRGEVNAVRAANYTRVPPNPNAGLNRFVVADPAGGSVPVWDASAWYDFMKTDSAWDSSAWADSAWLDSAWMDSAWVDSAWLDSAWLDSAWNDSAWADATSYEDNAEGEGVGADQPLTPTADAEIAADPDLALPTP